MELHELTGLIPEAVGEALKDYASKVPGDLAIVEVGSYKGKSTCYLATGAQAGEGAHVYAVDPWDSNGNPNGKHNFAQESTRLEFESQLEAMELRDHVTAVQGFSVEVAKDFPGPPIGLLYIDGDHEYESVLADYRAWQPYFHPLVTVLFDDVDTPRNPGVRQAIEEIQESTPDLNFRITAERLGVLSC